MRDYNLSFTAGQEQTIDVIGNFMHYVRGLYDLKFTFDSSANTGRFTRQVGSSLKLVRYGKVTIKSETAQSVTVCLGEGESYSAPTTDIENANLDIPTANSFVPLEDVTIPANQTLILVSANNARKELRVTNPESSTGAIRIGDNGTTATKGGLLFSGATDYIETSAAIYAHNPTSSDVTVSLVSIEAL